MPSDGGRRWMNYSTKDALGSSELPCAATLISPADPARLKEARKYIWKNNLRSDKSYLIKRRGS